MSVDTGTAHAQVDARSREALNEAENDPRTRVAIGEPPGPVRSVYPTASFAITHGKEPPGLFPIATIDEDDIDDAHDLAPSRPADLRVNEELPLYVIAERPLEQALAARQRGEAAADVGNLLRAGSGASMGRRGR